MKAGYSFDGWFRDEDFRERYSFSDPVIGNMELWAKFSLMAVDPDSVQTQPETPAKTQAQPVQQVQLQPPSSGGFTGYIVIAVLILAGIVTVIVIMAKGKKKPGKKKDQERR